MEAGYPISITSTGQSDTANIKTYYNPPIRVKPGSSLTLVNATIPFSIYNISAALGNNEFEYSHNSGTDWNTVTIPDGYHTVYDINNYMRDTMRTNAHYNEGATGVESDDIFYVEIEGFSTGKVGVTLSNNYQARFLTTTSTLYTLLGYNADTTLTTDGINHAPNVPAFDVLSRIFIHVDCVEGRGADGGVSDVIYSFSFTSSPWSFEVLNNLNPYGAPVTKTEIKSMTVRLTDENGTPLNLHGEDTSFFFILRGLEQ